jgi:predicted lipase
LYLEAIALQVPELIYALELSALAYKDVQPRPPCGRLTSIDDPESGVQCYIRQCGHELFITFRGSNSEQDWKTNLTFYEKSIPYGSKDSKIRVHAGFVDAYGSPAVRGTIRGMMTDEIACVKIMGHSHGAALAILCASDLEEGYPEKDFEVLLFGAPRVGNKAFRDSYNRRVFKTLRVENGNDIVTKVPFVFWGYRHVGIKVHVGPPRIPLVFSLNDHRPQAYYRNLFKRFPPELPGSPPCPGAGGV